MIARTFFNKAIYLSDLKRFWVGSVLYTIVLSLMICIEKSRYVECFDDVYIELAFSGMYLSIYAAVVVAMLVYGFVHSKKESVLVHSMNVKRSGGNSSMCEKRCFRKQLFTAL